MFSLISLDSKSKVTASENNVVLGYNWASMDLYYAPELYLGAKGSESFGLGFDFNFKKDTSNLYYGFGFAFESPEEHDDLNYLYGRIGYNSVLSEKLHLNLGTSIGYAYNSATIWEDRYTIWEGQYYEPVTYYGNESVYATPGISLRYALTDNIELHGGFNYQLKVSGEVAELYGIPFGLTYALGNKFGITLGGEIVEGEIYRYGLSAGFYW